MICCDFECKPEGVALVCHTHWLMKSCCKASLFWSLMSWCFEPDEHGLELNKKLRDNSCPHLLSKCRCQNCWCFCLLCNSVFATCRSQPSVEPIKSSRKWLLKMCIKGREWGFPIDLYTATFSLQQGIFSMSASKKKSRSNALLY